VETGSTLAKTVDIGIDFATETALSGRNSVWLSAADAVDGHGEWALALASAPPNADPIPIPDPIAPMQVTPFPSNPASMDAPRPYPTRERTPVHVLQARVRRWNPDLPVDTDTYRAAVLLLAGLEYGQNLDLLARRTSLARAFVAKAARRLIDNGVWQGGKTVVDWDLGEQASPSFWNDVAVAEGRLCRRIAEDGTIEWAPPGFWNKSYQYADADAQSRLDTVYHDAGRRGDETIPLADERVADNGQAEAPQSGATAATPAPAPTNAVPAPSSPDSGNGNGNGNGNGDGHTGEQPPSLMEIFSDAVWIR
jgi:hypothetical protein